MKDVLLGLDAQVPPAYPRRGRSQTRPSGPVPRYWCAMYEAFCGDIGSVVLASDYADFSAGERASYRDSLSCTSCSKPAYFIRRARNGRAACFGARPHGDDCELAAALTDDRGSGYLPSDEPVFNRSDELLLQPARVRAVSHARHAPGGEPREGSARRFVGPGGTRGARSNLGLKTLLRRLVRERSFAANRAMIVLPDNTRMSIAALCVAAFDAEDRHNGRLYWGTIRYVNEDEDGAWFNLGWRGAPSVRVDSEFLAELMAEKDLDDAEDLQGAAFLYYGPMRKANASGRLLLFPKDLDWFTLRLADEDLV